MGEILVQDEPIMEAELVDGKVGPYQVYTYEPATKLPPTIFEGSDSTQYTISNTTLSYNNKIYFVCKPEAVAGSKWYVASMISFE